MTIEAFVTRLCHTTDAAPYRDHIEIEGKAIALRPPALSDYEWQAVCRKLTGREFDAPRPVLLPDNFDNLRLDREGRASPRGSPHGSRATPKRKRKRW